LGGPAMFAGIAHGGLAPTWSNKMDRSKWTTYATTGYDRDVANDHRSQGGVHHHQVRLGRDGRWQYRILQSNGRHEAASAVEILEYVDGLGRWRRAEVL